MTENGIKNKTTIKNIAKVSFSNGAKLIAGVLIAFLLPKIIGVTDYGYYRTFTLYATYCGLFHFGIEDGIYLKYGGMNYEQLDKTRFRFFSKFLLVFELCIGFVVFLISCFALVGPLKLIFICLSVYLFSYNITGYYQMISQITGRFNELSIRNVIQSFLMAIGIIVLWMIHKFSNTIISYAWYTIIHTSIFLFLTLWYIFTYRLLTVGTTTKERGKWSELLYFIKIGFPLLVANLCSTFILSLDKQFVSVLFSTEDFAVYSFAYNMLQLITIATSAISTVFYPSMKRTDKDDLTNMFSHLIAIITIFVSACLLIYSPLCAFVKWFLPKYSNSLPIFQIILPGLVISSSITIIMSNYYKVLGKSFSFFVKSLIILLLSALLNYLAYVAFKTTSAISISSIIVMVIWYFVIIEYFVKYYKVRWFKNFIYMVLMIVTFYLTTLYCNYLIGFFVYLIDYILFTLAFYNKEISIVWNTSKRR